MKLDLKILKPKKKFKKGGIHVNPEVYWVSALGVTAFIVLVMMVFGYILFQRVDAELVPVTDADSRANKIDKARIDRTLEYFKKRELVSDEIINMGAPVVDPSR